MRSITLREDEVIGVLCGRKTQKRVAIRPQPEGEPQLLSEWSRMLAWSCGDANPDEGKITDHGEKLRGRLFPFSSGSGLVGLRCPVGSRGEDLWVKETLRTHAHFGFPLSKTPQESDLQGRIWSYAADRVDGWTGSVRSVHMPRWASRVTLSLEDVRVERLQSISEKDALAEGLGGRDVFAFLWDSRYGLGSWQKNPWVWVLEFKRKD